MGNVGYYYHGIVIPVTLAKPATTWAFAIVPVLKRDSAEFDWTLSESSIFRRSMNYSEGIQRNVCISGSK